MATENDTLNDMFVVPFDSLNNDDVLHVNSPVGMNDSLYEIDEKCTQHSSFAHLNIQTMMQVTLITI